MHFKYSAYIFWIVFACYALTQISFCDDQLFWNDEGYTMVFGKRVSEYGLPLADDGKNHVYGSILTSDGPLFERKNTNVEAGWFTYYWAGFAHAVTKNISNIFLQTGLIRFLFLLWYLGSVLLCSRWLLKRTNQWTANILFVLLLATCVPLNLLSNQARYYSIATFWLIWLFILLFELQRQNKWRFVGIQICMFMLMHTFYPFFVVGMIWLISRLVFAEKKARKQTIYLVLTAVLVALPAMWWYKIFKVQALGEGNIFENVFTLLKKLTQHSHLALFLIVSAISLRRLKKEVLWILFCWISFITVITSSPIEFLFSRYFMPLYILTPLLLISMLYKIHLSWINQKSLRLLAIGLMSAFLFVPFSERNFFYKNQLVSAFTYNKKYYFHHSYRGVVDVLVPIFQKENIRCIATNYEEYPFIYYLNVKILGGFEGRMKFTGEADAIVYRKCWRGQENRYNSLLSKHDYSFETINQFDYFVNNIPELDYIPHYLFEEPDNEKFRLHYYILQK